MERQGHRITILAGVLAAMCAGCRGGDEEPRTTPWVNVPAPAPATQVAPVEPAFGELTSTQHLARAMGAIENADSAASLLAAEEDARAIAGRIEQYHAAVEALSDARLHLEAVSDESAEWPVAHSSLRTLEAHERAVRRIDQRLSAIASSAQLRPRRTPARPAATTTASRARRARAPHARNRHGADGDLVLTSTNGSQFTFVTYADPAAARGQLLTRRARSRALRSAPTVGYGYPCAENGSCYGDISALTGHPRTVNVRGYYRRDGTYVRGHYRSRPR
jgi:hypothetical protein